MPCRTSRIEFLYYTVAIARGAVALCRNLAQAVQKPNSQLLPLQLSGAELPTTLSAEDSTALWSASEERCIWLECAKGLRPSQFFANGARLAALQEPRLPTRVRIATFKPISTHATCVAPVALQLEGLATSFV